MSGPFPIRVTGADGIGVLDGEATFPDPDNAPSSGPPFQPAAGDDVTLLETSGGQSLIEGGDDTGGVTITDSGGVPAFRAAAGNVTVGDAGTGSAILHGSSVAIQANSLGFYGTSPVAQPAAPTDTASIIAALKALGLVAS